MNAECWKVNGSGDSAVVHATAWSYGCFAELKENTEGTTNSTKGHEILETTKYTDYTEKTINASQTSDMVLIVLLQHDMMDC